MQHLGEPDSSETLHGLLDECCALISDIATWDEAERLGADREATDQQFTVLGARVRTFAGNLGTCLRQLRRHHPELKDRIDEIESLNLLSQAHRQFPPPSLRGALEDLKDMEVWLPQLFTKAASRTKTLADRPTATGPSKPHRVNLDPDVAKRRAIVAQNAGMSAKEVCKRFDLDTVPLPNDWDEKFDVQKWADAYKKPALRSRIDTIVSKDKHP